MDDYEVRLLQGLLTNPAWTDLYVLVLKDERTRVSGLLEMSQTERPAPNFNDDYLRGYARGLRFAIHRGEDLLKEDEQAALNRLPPGPEPEAVGSPYRDSGVQG
jgi:hypothetical protein